MQKIKWKNHKVKFLLFIFVCAFLLQAIITPLQFSSVAIVNALGVDTVNGQYMVSMQIITPKFETGVTKNIEVIRASNTSMSQCFKNISTNLGKTLGFAHLNAIVISKELLQTQSLEEILKPLILLQAKNLNAPILTTTTNANSILTAKEQEGNIYDIANFFMKQQNKWASIKNVTSQMKEQSPLILPVVKLETQAETIENEEGLAENIKKLKFDGEWLFLKNKEEQVSLTSIDYENLSLFNKGKNITLTTKETLGEDVMIINSHAKLTTSFYNGVPRLYLNVFLDATRPNSEIIVEDTELKNEIIKLTKEKITNAFFILKQYDIDLFFIKEHFSAFHNNNWEQYLNTLTSSNIFKKLELFTTVSVKLKNQISLAY